MGGKSISEKNDLNSVLEKLKMDHARALKLKEENVELRKKLESLTENNQKMAGALEKVDKKMSESKFHSDEKLVYSFQEGMMVKEHEIEKKKLELKKEHLTLEDINNQLNEILTMIEEDVK